MNEPIPSGEIPSITHVGPAETLMMNKYHFLLVLERTQRRPKPHGEWCFVALSLFLGLMPSVVMQAEFKPAFGLAAPEWKALVVGVFGIALVATIGLGVAWVIRKCMRPDRTPEQVLDEIVAQMDADNERARRRA